jgi:hypothetical protein
LGYLGVMVSFFRPKSEGYDHSLNAPGWEVSFLRQRQEAPSSMTPHFQVVLYLNYTTLAVNFGCLGVVIYLLRRARKHLKEVEEALALKKVEGEAWKKTTQILPIGYDAGYMNMGD